MEFVKVKKSFYDKEADLKLRNPGDEYNTTPERAKYLSERGFVEIKLKAKAKTIKTD